MTIEITNHFQADVERIYQLLTDTDFLKEQYQTVGARKVEFSRNEQQDGGRVLEWTREVPTDPPAALSSFFSDWTRTREKITWTREDEGYRGDYRAELGEELHGYVEGQLRLFPGNDGCVEEVFLKAVIQVPVLGKAIAAYAEGHIRDQLDRERAFVHKRIGET